MTNYYVDFTATGGTNAGTSWENAIYTYAAFETLIEVTMTTPGDSVYVMGGQQYTANAYAGATTVGTYYLPFNFIGVKAGTTAEPPTAADWAYGTERPEFVLGGDYLLFNDYWNVSNIICEGTGTIVLRVDVGCRTWNCSITNSSTTADREGVDSQGYYFMMHNCYVECTNGVALDLSGINSAHNTYINNSKIGVSTNNTDTLSNCIINDCTTGIEGTTSDSLTVVSSAIYNCTTGISIPGTAERPGRYMNNSISGCTDGMKLNFSGSPMLNTFMDYNNWYNNTRDISTDNGSTEDNSMKGSNDIAVDPKFTDPTNDDFTLQSDSLLRNAGMPMLDGVA